MAMLSQIMWSGKKNDGSSSWREQLGLRHDREHNDEKVQQG